MDDILLVTKDKQTWRKEDFLKSFVASDCYWQPLKLERADNSKFLETSFDLSSDGLTTRLKNDNEESVKVWRYHDYRSRLDYVTKRATILSTLRKISHHASNSEQLYFSAIAKCKEFLKLGYPRGILRHMCLRSAFITGRRTWFTVRNNLPTDQYGT